MIKRKLSDAIKNLSKYIRTDLALAALLKACNENITQIKEITDEVFLRAKKIISSAIYDRNKLVELEKIIAKHFKLNSDMIISAINDNLTLNVLFHQLIFANKIIRNLRVEFDKILQKLLKIYEFVSYFRIPKSYEEVTKLWRVPNEWADEYLFTKLFIEDERITKIKSNIINFVFAGANVIITGDAGVGKTSLLYCILVETSRIRNTCLLVPGTNIGTIHEKLGMILFVDDLPHTVLNLETIFRAKNIIATARIHDWLELVRNYPQLKANFIELKLEKASDEFLKTLALRLLSQYKIDYDEKAVNIVVKKAQGIPMYVYQLIKDLLLIKHKRGFAKLDIKMAETIPRGMYEYIGELLVNTIANKKGGKAMIAALKCISLLKGKAINALHLAILYEGLCIKLGEKPNWDLYSDIHHLMLYDPSKMLIKIPHDMWIDVLRGASRILSPIIRSIDIKIPDRIKIELLRTTALETWMKVLDDLKYRMKRKPASSIDFQKALNLAEIILREFPALKLPEINRVLTYNSEN